jgi:hypothetical protein
MLFVSSKYLKNKGDMTFFLNHVFLELKWHLHVQWVSQAEWGF